MVLSTARVRRDQYLNNYRSKAHEVPHDQRNRQTALCPDFDRAKASADGSLCYAAETGSGYIRMKEIMDLLKEQNYPGNAVIELFDYSPVHMLEGIQESVKWAVSQWAE